MKLPSLQFHVLGAALLLAACEKAPEVAKPAAAESPKAAVVTESRIDSAIAEALTPETPKESPLANEARDILARYPTKNAEELLNVPEVNEKLRIALTKLSQDKALLARINSSVDLAAQITGLEGPPGSMKLDLDMKTYDQARTSRMLQAVISEDPRQIVGFLVGEIGEAAPDLSYGGMERAPNGVAIVPNPVAPPATPKTDSPE